MVFRIFAFFFLVLHATSSLPLNEDLPVFSCEPLVLRNETQLWGCMFNDLHLTRNNLRFQPYNPTPQEVTTVYISNSIVEVFTALDICTYFPKVRAITLGSLGIEELAPNGLFECKDLRSFSIISQKTEGERINLFEEIPAEFFKTTPNLVSITIQDGSLKVVKADQFWGLPKLIAVSIVGTMIEDFPWESIENRVGVITLELYSNRLKDLAAEEIDAEYPRLIEVAYSDNDIKCSRAEEIREAFSDIPVKDISFNRERDDETEVIGGIICVKD